MTRLLQNITVITPVSRSRSIKAGCADRSCRKARLVGRPATCTNNQHQHNKTVDNSKFTMCPCKQANLYTPQTHFNTTKQNRGVSTSVHVYMSNITALTVLAFGRARPPFGCELYSDERLQLLVEKRERETPASCCTASSHPTIRPRCLGPPSAFQMPPATVLPCPHRFIICPTSMSNYLSLRTLSAPHIRTLFFHTVKTTHTRLHRCTCVSPFEGI